MNDLRKAVEQALEALDTVARFTDPLAKWSARKIKGEGLIVSVFPHALAVNAAISLRTAFAAEREGMTVNSIHSCHAECDRPACVLVREAVRAEREACAKVCEAQRDARIEAHPARVEFSDNAMSLRCAAAIRARGET